jgi:hypothetical protein
VPAGPARRPRAGGGQSDPSRVRAAGATTVDLAGLYRDEHVLRAAGRDEDEPAHRTIAGVPDGVGRPPRHEDEAAGGDRDLAVAEQERGDAVRDVERLVRVRVEVQRRSWLTRRERPDMTT